MTAENGASRVINVQGVTCSVAPGCDIEHVVVSAYSSLESEPGMASERGARHTSQASCLLNIAKRQVTLYS